MPRHKNIPVGEQSAHPLGYVQSSDPGAVGPYKPWTDTTGGTGAWVLKVRNAADSGWETVGSAPSSIAWSAITGEPTTLSGYGITDAAALVHTHAAGDITSGTVATARLGSGTANSGTYLRGDQTWAAVPAGGATDLDGLSDVTISSPANGQALVRRAGVFVNDALAVADVSGAAPLASPTFTGTPLAPTPATADNTTKIATTAHVHAALAAAGVSGTSFTYYDPFKPFATPSALCDEFPGPSLDAKWTSVGPQTPTLTFPGAGRGLAMQSPAAGTSFTPSAIEQTLPAGNFSIFARIAHRTFTTFGISGIYLRNATSGVRWVVGPSRTGASNSGLSASHSTYSSFTNRTAVTDSAWGNGEEMWIWLSSNGTTVTAYVSHDGKSWGPLAAITIATTFSAGAPNRVGISLDTYDGSQVSRIDVNFFRYSSSDTAVLGGTRTALGS